jgi:hypothetical protein
MTTTDEKREWLTKHGYEVPGRGRLSKTLQDIYDLEHPGEAADPDDAGVNADDFAADEETTPVVPETRPRRPQASRTRGRKAGGILGSLLGGKTASGKPKAGKKHPRVPLDKMMSRIYTRGGQMLSAFAPATGRCLQAQSAMAGVILEDITRDTVADRIFQPMARIEDKLDKTFALVAPPVLVFALETTDPDNARRQVMLTGLLRESLLISMDVTAAYAGRVAEQAARTQENEAAVDKLLEFIFTVPVPEPEMAGTTAA